MEAINNFGLIRLINQFAENKARKKCFV